MSFDHRHLLGIEPLSPAAITTILDLAEKAYQTLMYARLYEALEGTTDNEDEE